MDIREKLVDLLGSLTTVQVFCDMDGDPVSRLVSRVVAEEDVDGLADHLIANGVTVQGNAEWERKEHDRCGVFWFECSECHIKWGYGAVLHMKYCPNCGLIMKPLLPPKGE